MKLEIHLKDVSCQLSVVSSGMRRDPSDATDYCQLSTDQAAFDQLEKRLGAFENQLGACVAFMTEFKLWLNRPGTCPNFKQVADFKQAIEAAHEAEAKRLDDLRAIVERQNELIGALGQDVERLAGRLAAVAGTPAEAQRDYRASRLAAMSHQSHETDRTNVTDETELDALPLPRPLDPNADLDGEVGG